ncbi:MAG: hypothetical protein Q9209_001599 [Squamulea sp. 1 TL-2023]
MSSIAPGIALDTTLADLYRADGVSEIDMPTLLPCYWCSDVDYQEGIPKTSKYLYQGTPVPQNTDEVRALVIQCLSLECQRFLFAAGDMKAVLFDWSGDRNNRLEVAESLGVLCETQQPKTCFASDLEDLEHKTSSSKVAVVVPHEGLFAGQQVVHPDVLYTLLSKRCLALSGLLTPRSIVLDLDDLDGSVDQKLALASSWIRCFMLPRVFKTQQGMSSIGTFTVRNEQERSDLIECLSSSILRRTLASVTPANKYLYPSTLVSQEMISQAEDCFAVSFFVKRNGECVFLGACRQDMSESNDWLGASINYLKQKRLRRNLWGTITKVSSFLTLKGYYGPAGADIILEGGVNGRNILQPTVVDLNVRMMGSLNLCLLKGHFSRQRNLHEACITQRLKFSFTRDQFQNLLSKEISLGKVIIVAWYYDRHMQHSWGTMILGGADAGCLEDLYNRVKALSS